MLLPTGAPPYDAAAGSWIEILIIPPRVPSRPVEKPEASSSCSRQRKSRGTVGRSRRWMDRSNEIHPHFNICTPLFCLCFCSQRLYPALPIHLSIDCFCLYGPPVFLTYAYGTTVGTYLQISTYHRHPSSSSIQFIIPLYTLPRRRSPPKSIGHAV
jgi:hypothetical protein